MKNNTRVINRYSKIEEDWVDRINESFLVLLYFLSRYVKRRLWTSLVTLVLLSLVILVWRDNPELWKIWVGIFVSISMVNIVLGTKDEIGKPHVHVKSFHQALTYSRFDGQGSFAPPQLLKVKTWPSGDVEILVSATVPESTWLLPEVADVFCGAFGVQKFRKVYRDAQNRIHLVLAAGKLNAPSVELDELLKKVTKDQEISLGVGFQGPVVWNWNQTPHILTAGATGAGKSSLVRWMMAVLVRAGYPVYLVDPKNAVDFFFAVDLLAGPVATNAEQAIPVLDKLWAEHEQRTKQLREVRCASLTEAHAIGKLLDLTQIFCFVDELAVFQLNSKYKATKEAGAYCVTRLEQLALAARATGISLFLASQYPKSDILPSAIKQQAHKICFRVEDSVASEMILDARGAETLSPITPGRALSRVGTELEEWQAYYFTTEHLDQWLHFKIKGEELN